MKRKIKIINTLIRFSIDGKTWSNKMTALDFIRRCPSSVDLVEITEVMDKNEILKLLEDSYISINKICKHK